MVDFTNFSYSKTKNQYLYTSFQPNLFFNGEIKTFKFDSFTRYLTEVLKLKEPNPYTM